MLFEEILASELHGFNRIKTNRKRNKSAQLADAILIRS